MQAARKSKLGAIDGYSHITQLPDLTTKNGADNQALLFT